MGSKDMLTVPRATKEEIQRVSVATSPLKAQRLDVSSVATGEEEAGEEDKDAEIDELALRRDPEEEYFMLAVLAHRMTHTEEQDHPEYVYEINPKALF